MATRVMEEKYTVERDGEGKWQPGASGNPRGKPKGTVDGATLLKMSLAALDAVGGQTWLEERARKSPAAFLSYLAKILPRDMQLSAEAVLAYEEWARVLRRPRPLKQPQQPAGESLKVKVG